MQQNTSSTSIHQQIAKKKYTTIIYGSTIRDDFHNQAQLLRQGKDLSVYHDTPQQRVKRNQKDIESIIAHLRSGKIPPQMLQFQIGNLFYPSYILYHHFAHFQKLLAQIIDRQKLIPQTIVHLFKDCCDFKAIGAIFHQTINIKFKKSKQSGIKLINGLVSMDNSYYCYSSKTNLHVSVCCLVIKGPEYTSYAIIQLRNQKGEIADNIEVKYFGPIISLDYMLVGYKFNQVQPLFIFQQKKQKIYRNIKYADAAVQFGYSINDLIKGLYITTQYTSMRRQFQTLDQSKEERKIVSYQGVGSRIIDGYALLFILCYYRQRLLGYPIMQQIIGPYLPYLHRIILQQQIQLRECCGGFGYMQISGHPGIIQRLVMRSARETPRQFLEHPDLMKRVHYFTSEPQLYQEYMKNMSPDSFKSKDVLNLFCIVCMNMKKSQTISGEQNLKEFIRQSCYQMMNVTVSQYMIEKPGNYNLAEELLFYSMIKYSIENAKFIDWSFCSVQISKYTESILELKNKKLQLLVSNIPYLCELLEVRNTGNTTVAQQNGEQFYREVYKAAQQNRRNSSQYRSYVQEPLIKLIKEQRSKL